MTESPLFSIKGLQKLRIGDDGSEFELCIPDLDIPRGKVIAICGPSGCGKSTLLNLLGGLDSPDKGQILFRQTEAHPPYKVCPTDFPHTKVGRVFQLGHLLNFSSVSVNIALALEARGIKATRRIVLDGLRRAGLSERHLDMRISQLSGGEQQRVAVARALAGDPELILADEPTSSLDPEIGNAVMEALSEWCKDGKGQRSVIWVTHNYDQLERYANIRLTLASRASQIDETPDEQLQSTQRENAQRSLVSMSGVPTPSKSPKVEGDVRNEAEETAPQQACTHSLGVQDIPVSTQQLRRKAAMGLVFRRIRKSGDEDTLAPLLSIGLHWPRRFTHLLAKAFSEWSLSIRILMSALMVLVTATGFTIQKEQAKTIINDPETCQVRIGGDTRLATNIVPSTLLALGEQPWLSEEGIDRFAASIEAIGVEDPLSRGDLMQLLSERSDGNGCATKVAAWPRDDIDMEAWLPAPSLGCQATASMINYDENGKEVPFRPFTIEVLSVHRDEPSLQSMRLIPDAAGSVGDALQGQNRAGRRLGVVLSEAFVRFRLQKSPEEVMSHGRICLRRSQLMQAVEILGISGELPADHNYVYDAVLPLTALDSERQLSDRDDFYSTAVLYFQAQELEQVERFLRPVDEQGVVQRLSFRFDPDALSRLKDAIGANLATRATFVAVGGLAILVAIYSIGAAAASVIQTHSAPLAMLMTLGLPKGFVCGIVETFAAAILVLAIVVLFPIWLFIYFGMELTLFSLPYDLRMAVFLWLVLFCTLYFATLIAVRAAFGRWSRAVSKRMATTLTMR